MRREAIYCVSTTSGPLNCVRSPKNGGIFKPTPNGANTSPIVNPRSAITSSPRCNRVKNPLLSTSRVSDIEPVYREETNITYPAGLTPSNALNVSLSTVVLNSRDWYEIVWFPDFSHFIKQPSNRLYPKKPTGMHW